jgi:hypothetical protein
MPKFKPGDVLQFHKYSPGRPPDPVVVVADDNYFGEDCYWIYHTNIDCDTPVFQKFNARYVNDIGTKISEESEEKLGLLLLGLGAHLSK